MQLIYTSSYTSVYMAFLPLNAACKSVGKQFLKILDLAFKNVLLFQEIPGKKDA